LLLPLLSEEQLTKSETIIDIIKVLVGGLIKITANEKGLAFVGELAFRQPITEAQ